MALASCSRQQALPPTRVPVTVAHAETRMVPLEVQATGTVEPISTVDVFPQVNGPLEHVHFAEGDEVQQGQVLFEIDPRPYQAALQQAQAALGRDLVQLTNAQQETDRYRGLLAGRSVSDEEFQAKEAASEALLATVRADSAAVSAAQLNLDYATVRAPISGRTGNLNVKEGNLVRTTSTTPLVTINEMRPILVRFPVPSAELPELTARAHDALEVLAAARDTLPPLEGVLSFIDNHVDQTTGTVMLKGRFPNTAGTLWPGEFVSVTLILGRQNATVVPAQAVVTGQQGTFVFTLHGDSAHQQPVTVSRTVDSVAVITDGLTPGTVVVTDGQVRLTPNARVEIKGGGGTRSTSLGGRTGT